MSSISAKLHTIGSILFFVVLLAIGTYAQIIITPPAFVSGAAGTIVGGTCVNQFIRSLDTSGTPTCASVVLSSDITGFGANVITALGTAIGSVGAPVVLNGAGGTPSAITLTNGTGLPISGIASLGTGVGAALGTNIGSAGAPVLFNGAGGTPSSLTLTNATGLLIAGITGLAAGIATFLATPSSANFASAITDETGSGLVFLATAPAFGTYYDMTEMAAPSAPAANTARVYSQDNGAGKTQLCVLFNTGAAQCFATQP